MPPPLFDLLPETISVGYLLVFLGMAFEGELTLFTALYLGTIGYLKFEYLGIVLVTGLFAGDLFWYRLGIFLQEHPSFRRMRRWAERVSGLLDEQLAVRPIKTLFASKFTYGLNRLALVRAGMRKVPLITFLEADILAVVAWLSTVGGVGFLLSKSFAQARSYLKYVELGFVGAIFLFIALTHLVSRYSYAQVKENAREVHKKRNKRK